MTKPKAAEDDGMVVLADDWEGSETASRLRLVTKFTFTPFLRLD